MSGVHPLHISFHVMAAWFWWDMALSFHELFLFYAIFLGPLTPVIRKKYVHTTLHFSLDLFCYSKCPILYYSIENWCLSRFASLVIL